MADKTVGDLPESLALNDDSLLVMEQNGEARKIKGKVIRDWVSPYAETAQNAANTAQNAAQGVQTAIQNIPVGSTPIVNDLTTGGTKMALSAEMGKLLGQRPNPNLIDNWYFADPINQRGQTEYTDGYTIDRWRSASVKVNVVDGGIVLNNTNTTTTAVYQYIELDTIKAILGHKVTLSALTADGFYSGTVTLPTAIAGMDTSNITIADGVSVDLLGSSDGTACYLRVLMVGGASVTLKAIKLELGSVQTLAYQDASGNWVLNDPPPNKQQELAKCMRYQVSPCQLIESGSPAFVGMGTSTNNGTAVFILCPVLEPLRGIPAVSHAGVELIAADLSTYIGVSDITVYPSYAKNMVTLSVKPNTAVAGSSVFYLVGRYAGSKLLLDANL